MKLDDIYALLERALLSRATRMKRTADGWGVLPPVQKCGQGGSKRAVQTHLLPRAGRPDKPVLVAPSPADPRKINTAKDYAAMLRAIAHIKFNAVNLALDAAPPTVFRTLPFPGCPRLGESGRRKRCTISAWCATDCALSARLRQFSGAQPFVGYGVQNRLRPAVAYGVGTARVEARGLDVRQDTRKKVAQRGDSKPAAYWTSFTATKWVMSPSAAIGINTLPRTRFRNQLPCSAVWLPVTICLSSAAMWTSKRAKKRASAAGVDMLEDFEQGLKQNKKNVTRYERTHMIHTVLFDLDSTHKHRPRPRRRTQHPTSKPLDYLQKAQ